MLRAPTRLVTQRLVIRCWEAGDGAALEEAIDASLAELRPWMPWAHAEPTPVEELEARIARFRDAFVKGEDFVYGIWDAGESRVIGGTGLHPRIGPDALEIGYWILSDMTRRAFATWEITPAELGAR